MKEETSRTNSSEQQSSDSTVIHLSPGKTILTADLSEKEIAEEWRRFNETYKK